MVGVRGFPTIMRFSGVKYHTFKGERNLQQLIQFATQPEGDPMLFPSGIKYKLALADAWSAAQTVKMQRAANDMGALSLVVTLVGGMLGLLLVGFLLGYLFRKHEVIPLEIQVDADGPKMKLGLMITDWSMTFKTGDQLNKNGRQQTSHFYVPRTSGEAHEIPILLQFIAPAQVEDKKKKISEDDAKEQARL